MILDVVVDDYYSNGRDTSREREIKYKYMIMLEKRSKKRIYILSSNSINTSIFISSCKCCCCILKYVKFISEKRLYLRLRIDLHALQMRSFGLIEKAIRLGSLCSCLIAIRIDGGSMRV